MNEERFDAIMKDLYRTCKGKSPSMEDFQNIIERNIHPDMSWLFDQRGYGAQIPKYSFRYKTERTPEGKCRVHCRVRQGDVQEEFRSCMTFHVEFGGHRFPLLWIEGTGIKPELDLLLLPAQPEKVVSNDLHSVVSDVEQKSCN